MRLPLKTVCGMLLLAGGMNLRAIPASELAETYQPIVDRNPFGLKPPPPPPTNNPTAQPVKEKPKTEIFLTGITSVGYPRFPKQVYLMTMTKEQNKKQEPNYYTLTEGVEKDGIKVLSIDDAGKRVRVHTEDDGEVMLTFQTHGVAPPVAPAAAKPGQPGQPVPGQPGSVPVPQPGVTTLPQPVHNTAQPGGYPVVQPINSGGTTTPGIRQIPSRRVRAGIDNPSNVGVGGALPGPNGAPAQPEMDPAEQYIRMHLNNAAAQKQGIEMPPLPVIGQ